jgi:hypothetical protein
MSVTGFVLLAIAVWAIFASVRTIRRIGLRHFSLAIGRLGWDLGKVALSGAALVVGALAAASASGSDEDKPVEIFEHGYDPLDLTDQANHVRVDSPYYINKKEGEV